MASAARRWVMTMLSVSQRDGRNYLDGDVAVVARGEEKGAAAVVGVQIHDKMSGEDGKPTVPILW